LSKSNIVILIITAILTGTLGFFAGTKYQNSKQGSFPRQQGFNQRGDQRSDINGVIPNGGNRQGIRPVNGEITGIADNSVTVKLVDGSSKIVIVSGSTQINKSTDASKENLKVGEKIAVFGQVNQDGSVTAQTIQLQQNPAK
jgi:hypothetical protein